jgi:hypothetical protein
MPKTEPKTASEQPREQKHIEQEQQMVMSAVAEMTEETAQLNVTAQ